MSDAFAGFALTIMLLLFIAVLGMGYWSIKYHQHLITGQIGRSPSSSRHANDNNNAENYDGIAHSINNDVEKNDVLRESCLREPSRITRFPCPPTAMTPAPEPIAPTVATPLPTPTPTPTSQPKKPTNEIRELKLPAMVLGHDRRPSSRQPPLFLPPFSTMNAHDARLSRPHTLNETAEDDDASLYESDGFIARSWSENRRGAVVSAIVTRQHSRIAEEEGLEEVDLERGQQKKVIGCL